MNIETLEFMEGQLPRSAERLVLQWASLHQEELAENWRLRQLRQPLNEIAAAE